MRGIRERERERGNFIVCQSDWEMSISVNKEKLNLEGF